jgi:hypothetical protein
MIPHEDNTCLRTTRRNKRNQRWFRRPDNTQTLVPSSGSGNLSICKNLQPHHPRPSEEQAMRSRCTAFHRERRTAQGVGCRLAACSTAKSFRLQKHRDSRRSPTNSTALTCCIVWGNLRPPLRHMNRFHTIDRGRTRPLRHSALNSEFHRALNTTLRANPPSRIHRHPSCPLSPYLHSTLNPTHIPNQDRHPSNRIPAL